MGRIVLHLTALLLGAGPAIAQQAFVEQNTQRWGGDYARFEVSSAQSCSQECANDPNCQAWTFARPGAEGPSGVRHLKATVPHRVEDPCCESGVAVGVGEETRPPAMRAARGRGEQQVARR